MKQYGCKWTGSLRELDQHLNPMSGECNYLPIQCPDCCKLVQKTEMSAHLEKECYERVYRCPYCNFQATYKIVSSEHSPICSYYPLRCQNMCGVTCERETMDYHMTICPLQEINCEFDHIGCKEKFLREQKEIHDEKNTQKHLALVGTTGKSIEGLTQALHSLREKIENKLAEEHCHVQQLKDEIREQKNEAARQLTHKEEQIQVLKGQILELETKFQRDLNQTRIDGCIVPYDLRFYNIRSTKSTFASINSQSLYTHSRGYKFHLELYPYGDGYGDRLSLSIGVLSEPGKYDNFLKWPAKFSIVLEIRNQHIDLGHCAQKIECEWERRQLGTGNSFAWEFILISDLEWNPQYQTCYLQNDSLCFRITEIKVAKV